MGSLIDFLGMGAVAKTKADAAALEGGNIKRDREQKDLLAALARQRQEAQDAQAAQTAGLQQRNLLDLIRERNEPPVAPPETFGTPFEAVESGKPVFVERGNRGTTRTLQGYSPPQKPVAAPGAQGPTRGTPAYEDMLRREAAARASGGGGERGATLPAPAIEKMIDLDDLIGMTKRARMSLGAAVNEGRNVTGRAGGIIPVANWIRNAVKQGGEVGIGVRSELANVSSTIMKMRSGAAVSDQEFARLEPFLASDDDDESVAMIKLRKLATALEEMKRIRLENYQRYGKPGIAQPRGEDPETGVDLDDAIAAEIERAASGRRP